MCISIPISIYITTIRVDEPKWFVPFNLKNVSCHYFLCVTGPQSRSPLC